MKKTSCLFVHNRVMHNTPIIRAQATTAWLWGGLDLRASVNDWLSWANNNWTHDLMFIYMNKRWITVWSQETKTSAPNITGCDSPILGQAVVESGGFLDGGLNSHFRREAERCERKGWNTLTLLVQILEGTNNNILWIWIVETSLHLFFWNALPAMPKQYKQSMAVLWSCHDRKLLCHG